MTISSFHLWWPVKTAVCPRSSPQETFCKRSFVAKSEERLLFLQAQSLIIQTVNTSNHNFAIYHTVNSKKKVSIVLKQGKRYPYKFSQLFPFYEFSPTRVPTYPSYGTNQPNSTAPSSPSSPSSRLYKLISYLPLILQSGHPQCHTQQKTGFLHRNLCPLPSVRVMSPLP